MSSMDGAEPEGDSRLLSPDAEDAAAPAGTGTEDASRLSPLALLLAVQSLDLSADQLSYRRRELPERAQLARLERSGTVLRLRMAEAGSRRDELRADQERLDRQVDMLTSRMAAIASRLDAGAAGSFRDQEAMANETASLERQRRTFEDQELEVMEALEPLEAELAALESELLSIEEARAVVASALGASEAQLEEELKAGRAEREVLAAGLPADLAAIYERLRAKLGGVGAARLVDGACSGCHLKLPARERDLIQHAPVGTIFYCEQCGRILVP